MAPVTQNPATPTDRTKPVESTTPSPTTVASGRMQHETIEQGNQNLWKPPATGTNAEQHLPNTTIDGAGQPANAPRPADATNPAGATQPALDGETVKKYTHELYEAINGNKPDNDKIQHILGSLSAADRKAIEDAYKQTNGNTDNRDIRTELKDRLGDDDFRKAESSLNKRDNRTNDAGNLMVSLSAIDNDRGDAERRVLESFSTLNAEQQKQLRDDFQHDYGMSVDEALKKFGVSGDAMTAVEFVSKPVEQRSAADIEKFARFAIEKGNLDYFGIALRGDTPAAIEARKNLSNNEEFKKQIVEAFKVHRDGGALGALKNAVSVIPGGDVLVGGFNLVEGLVKGDLDFDRLTEGTNFDKVRRAVEGKEIDSKLLQAMDILRNGQVSLATIAADNTGTIFGWFDNKDAISTAAEHATDAERQMFAKGQQLAQAGGEPQSEEDKNALAFYNSVHAAFDKAGNDNEPLKWEDRLLHGKDGSVISQILDSKDKEGRYTSIESLSQKDWERLKDPAAGAAFRKQIEEQLTKSGSKEEATAILKILDEKLAAGSYEDAQKVQRSLSDLITTSPHSKTAIAVIGGMKPEEAARYQTDAAFRAQVDTFLHDKLDELGQVASSRLLEKIAATGKPPEQDAIDKLFSDKLNGKEGKDAITDIEAVLKDAALRQKLAGPESSLNNVEKEIKKAIDEYITAATPNPLSPAYGRGTVPVESKDNEYLQALYQTGRLSVDQKAKLGLRGESFFSEAATVSPEERQRLYDSGLVSADEKKIIDTLTNQGGKMSLADEIRAAVIKDGTDAEEFANQLKGLSPEDKQKLKDEYAHKYGSALEQDVLNHVSDAEKNNFRTYLTAGEVDGRQDFYDNLERALHSESGYSPDGSQEVLDRSLSMQASMLSDFQSRYEKLPPEKQEEANQLFTEALKHYQDSKEKFAEKMFQAAVIVGGVAVGVATGGVGLAALASVVAIGAVGRIALKKAIQGNDYDITLSNVLKDGAIGGATAGLSVLGPETFAAMAGVGKAAAGSFLTSAGEQVAANVIKKDASAILQRELDRVISSSVVRGEQISQQTLDGIVAKVASSTATAEERAALTAVLQSTLETSGRQVSEEVLKASLTGMGRQAATYGTLGGTTNVAIDTSVGLANGHFDAGHLPQSFLVGFGLGSGMSAGLETAIRGAGKYAARDSFNAEPEADPIPYSAQMIEDCRRGRMPASEALDNATPYPPALRGDIEDLARRADTPEEIVQARNFFKNSQISDQYIVLGNNLVSPSAGRRITLGRNPNCDFELTSLESSRVHGEIELTDNGPVIRNLKHDNHTLVNGHVVPQEGFYLRDGDVIQMGNDRLVFGGVRTKAKPQEYTVAPGREDIAAAEEPLRQSTRMKDANEISERLLDGFQVYSHDVAVRFNENFMHPQGVPVVFDVLDRAQDGVLRQTLRDAHQLFDSLKHNPRALADELTKFAKFKMHPQGWTEDMVDASHRLFLQANKGKRMLLGNYIDMAQRGEGAGVCLQQAFLFKVLADDFGLDSTLVYGHYGNIGPQNIANVHGNHVWNQVLLDGESVPYDPRQMRYGEDYTNMPKHHPLRDADRSNDSRVFKLNELNLLPGAQVHYKGSPNWKVSTETSRQPGRVVLRHDALKEVSYADFVRLNPGRQFQDGGQFELSRTGGHRDLGWIYDGRSNDGKLRFRKFAGIREDVPVEDLKAALAPQLTPYQPEIAQIGDKVSFQGENYNVAQFADNSGKPILYQQGRGSGFANMFSHIKPEQLNDYRAITVEGKTIYANADLTRFYNVTPDPNGQLILSQNFEYLTVDDLSLLQLVKDPHQG